MQQVVDNSSAFRMTEGVPLVIPEVNPEAMSHVKIGGGGAIIANPNCSTIIALMAVTPLHRLAKVKRMIVSTYQAASGAGAAAMEELKEQTRDVLDGKEAKPVIFPYQVRVICSREWSGAAVDSLVRAAAVRGAGLITTLPASCSSCC
jgi:aspartate-semialdehyde dehydrogenase